MNKKEYKTGTKRYYITKDGTKLNRKAEDQRTNTYKRNTYKRVSLLIRRDETEVLEKLESVPSKNAYIVGLIMADIKASKR